MAPKATAKLAPAGKKASALAPLPVAKKTLVVDKGGSASEGDLDESAKVAPAIASPSKAPSGKNAASSSSESSDSSEKSFESGSEDSDSLPSKVVNGASLKKAKSSDEEKNSKATKVAPPKAKEAASSETSESDSDKDDEKPTDKALQTVALSDSSSSESGEGDSDDSDSSEDEDGDVRMTDTPAKPASTKTAAVDGGELSTIGSESNKI